MAQEIIRRTVNGKHVYSYKGSDVEYTGITSMLGMINKPWITDWKLRNRNWEKDLRRAAMIGSIVHKYCQMRAYVGKDEIDRTLFYKMKSWSEIMNCINAFELFMYQYQPKFVFAELKCIEPYIGFGCTVDVVLNIKGKLYVIDYKTSSSVTKEHKIQVVMCTAAFIYHAYGNCPSILTEQPPTPAILHLNKKTGKQKLIKIETTDLYYRDIGTHLVKFYNEYNFHC